MNFILVGNKRDLEEKRKVKESEGREFAEDNNMLFIETSAKDNFNITDLF